MAWPSAVTPLQSILATDINGIVTALQVWGGDVSAAGASANDLLGVGLHTANATWQEFRWRAIAGAGVASDALGLQVNGRSTSGGADAWSNVLTIASLTGTVSVASAVTFNGALTLGAGLNLNAQTISGAATFSGALALNGGVTLGAGGLNLNGQTVAGAGTLSGALTVSGSLAISTPANISFGSNWSNWTPIITASGSMTVSSVVIQLAQYLRVGPIVFFQLLFSATLGGTASNVLAFTIPIALAGGGGGIFSAAYGTILLQSYFPSTTQIGITQQGQPNYALGSNTWQCSGFYRVA